MAIFATLIGIGIAGGITASKLSAPKVPTPTAPPAAPTVEMQAPAQAAGDDTKRRLQLAASRQR